MNDEPVFSERAARDEDTRAEALALPDAGTLAAVQEDLAVDSHARFCWLVEASFSEYERRHRENPDALQPLAGYPVQTLGTYGAAVTPFFLQVMNEIMQATPLPVR